MYKRFICHSTLFIGKTLQYGYTKVINHNFCLFACVRPPLGGRGQVGLYFWCRWEAQTMHFLIVYRSNFLVDSVHNNVNYCIRTTHTKQLNTAIQTPLFNYTVGLYCLTACPCFLNCHKYWWRIRNWNCGLQPRKPTATYWWCQVVPSPNFELHHTCNRYSVSRL